MATEVPPGVQDFGPTDGEAVLVLHPWWGISPGVLAWKDALLAAGARVVLPDLYGGKVVDTIPEAEAMSNAVDDVAALALLDACADQLNATGRPWSALGWSMGAFYASQMMSRGDDAPQRAVLFYGAAAPAGASRTEAVQLHIAPDDEYFTDEEIADVLEAFARADISVERYDYPGLGHWFAEIGSPAYDEAGTALARQRAFTFLGLEVGA
jgi:carboxymethylenebutenolidase